MTDSAYSDPRTWPPGLLVATLRQVAAHDATATDDELLKTWDECSSVAVGMLRLGISPDLVGVHELRQEPPIRKDEPQPARRRHVDGGDLPREGFVRAEVVAEVLGISRSQLGNYRRDGYGPRFIRPSKSKILYNVVDVRACLRALHETGKMPRIDE